MAYGWGWYQRRVYALLWKIISNTKMRQPACECPSMMPIVSLEEDRS